MRATVVTPAVPEIRRRQLSLEEPDSTTYRWVPQDSDAGFLSLTMFNIVFWVYYSKMIRQPEPRGLFPGALELMMSGLEYLVMVAQLRNMDRTSANIRIHGLLRLFGIHGDRDVAPSVRRGIFVRGHIAEAELNGATSVRWCRRSV